MSRPKSVVDFIYKRRCAFCRSFAVIDILFIYYRVYTPSSFFFLDLSHPRTYIRFLRSAFFRLCFSFVHSLSYDFVLSLSLALFLALLSSEIFVFRSLQYQLSRRKDVDSGSVEVTQ